MPRNSWALHYSNDRLKIGSYFAGELDATQDLRNAVKENGIRVPEKVT
jgi:hypothetical protein